MIGIYKLVTDCGAFEVLADSRESAISQAKKYFLVVACFFLESVD